MPDGQENIVPHVELRDGLRLAARLAMQRSYGMQSGAVPPEEGANALMKLAETLSDLANKDTAEIWCFL